MSKRQISLGEVFTHAKMRSVLEVDERSPIMTFQSYPDDTTGDEMGKTSNFEEQVKQISDSVTVIPFDVSKTLSDNQYRPKLSVFPTRNGKQFQSHWYLKFPWIEYSQERDSVFCFEC